MPFQQNPKKMNNKRENFEIEEKERKETNDGVIYSLFHAISSKIISPKDIWSTD